jgi:biotin carboxyl carrier protein
VAVRAPMPGLIVRVEVEAGQLIRVGQGLVVLEAMKMENEIKALSAGKVADVHVTPGKAVEKGELLISLTQD